MIYSNLKCMFQCFFSVTGERKALKMIFWQECFQRLTVGTGKIKNTDFVFILSKIDWKKILVTQIWKQKNAIKYVNKFLHSLCLHNECLNWNSIYRHFLQIYVYASSFIIYYYLSLIQLFFAYFCPPITFEIW